MSAELLHYRPWRGTYRRPLYASWPIARVALKMMFRRKLFWAVYALAMLMFFMFFFGQYLLSWAESQAEESGVRVLGSRVPPGQLVHVLREVLRLNGRDGEMYGLFFQFQGYMVMVVLALAGSMLLGNDFQYGTLPYYLSKPINRVHYLLGKALAVAVFINLMTTIPAMVLWVQFGLLDTWSFFYQKLDLLGGILGYGALLTVCLSTLLLAAAVWVRRTVPLIMTWCTLLFFCRALANTLVLNLNMDWHWRLIDLWNCTYVVGSWLLHAEPGPKQPDVAWAALVLAVVSIICVTYLTLRVRAVEIVK
jgi:ABC-type transport system involved in multi-copper enzyme maturation permease subunit